MALSTYCRNCGEHLKISKGVAQLTSGPQLSGISKVRVVSEMARPPAEEEPESDEAGSNWLNPETSEETPVEPRPKKRRGRRKGKRERARAKQAKAEAAAREMREQRPASVAEVFGLTEAPPEEETPVSEPVADEKRGLGDDASAATDLAEGSMGAMISELVEEQKKTEETVETSVKKTIPKKAPVPKKSAALVRDQTKKTQIRVRCFRCNHRQWESKHAESTQCGRCNTYISLADYHIRQPTDRVIRTRGNVVIHRKGSLVGAELACRDLLVMGTISTKIDCSGEARFRNSALLRGNLYCQSLVVERGTIVEFPDGVFTEYAHIEGIVRGDLTCAGRVEVFGSGLIEGDVKARDLDLQGGGSFTGEMEIDEKLKIVLPVVKGYDPSIIE